MSFASRRSRGLATVETIDGAKYDGEAISMSMRKQFASGLMLAGLLVILAACQSQRPAAPKDGRYPLQGEVIAVDQGKRQVTVKHGAIPGLMPAMTMVYDVQDASQMKRLWPGDHIKADLVVHGGEANLQNITVQGK